MKNRSALSVLIILLSVGCVDRIFFDVGNGAPFTIVIDGQITNQPGPYKVEIFSAFNLESKLERTPISVKEIILSDNEGNREVMTDQDKGVYTTRPDGIQGTVGRAYSIHIEFFDGRVYESKPDTLFPPGEVDSIYHEFKEEKNPDGVSIYSFNVFFNSTSATTDNFHYIWKFIGTFKSFTHPELRDIVNNPAPCINYKCNFYDLCSGILNIGTNVLPHPGFTGPTAIFTRVAPCSCCTCWYNIFNNTPIVSSDQFANGGKFTAIKAYTVPLNRWLFQEKIHIQVNQMSLSRQAFAFWKAIKDQKAAVNSLFQPITGKIPGNMVQISGTPAPVSGLFYATSISSKATYITRLDVPNTVTIPSNADNLWAESCLTLFPNATTQKPTFWVE